MMKKTLMVCMGFLLFIAFYLGACVHEIPNDFCASDPVVLSVVKTDASSTQNNGKIAASATGGAGFGYSLNGAAFTSNGIFTGLQPNGNYRVVAKNSRGCTDTAEVQIGLIVSADPCLGVVITVSSSKTDAAPNQNNGSIAATASPAGTYSYQLNNGSFQSSGSFTALAAGNYTITAKNSNGCMGSASVTVGTSNPCAGVTVMVNTTKADPAAGQSNGTITASATGGTGFTYSLNNGTYQSSGTFTSLAAGNYTVTAKNSNGCTGVTTVALGAANPCAGVTITVTATKTDPVAGQSNGAITATASGGTGFTYSLNNGAFQSGGSFTGLAAGTYTVTAKSSAGCLGSTTITLTGANPCATTVLSISNAVVNVVACSSPAANGKITVTAGGSSGFTYNLNGGGYQLSNIFSSLAAGTFTVGVKDLNGCTKTTPATVGTAAPGPLFASVRTLITNRCSGSGCHISGGNAAGYNFDSDCSIVTNWSQINRSTVLYTLTKMPKNPQALFTQAEKLIITNWVNAGHSYGN
jgi:SprB repeat